MKVSERLDVIDRIGRALQLRFGFTEIEIR